MIHRDSGFGEVMKPSDQAECWGGCSTPNTALSAPKGVTLQAGCPSTLLPTLGAPRAPHKPQKCLGLAGAPKGLIRKHKRGDDPTANPPFCVTPAMAHEVPEGST